jgi:hypothetical protein
MPSMSKNTVDELETALSLYLSGVMWGPNDESEASQNAKYSA